MLTIRGIGFLLAAAACLGGCKGSSSDDGGLTYRPTTWYHLDTGDTDMGSLLLLVMSSADLYTIQAETGVVQAPGFGLIWGTVQDAAGTAISGAQVSALRDSGVSAGAPVYQDTDGAFKAALTATTTQGQFVIQNVAPGRVNLRCIAGASGNAYVDVVADETALVSVESISGAGTVTWSGVTRNLVNLPSTAEPAVTITGLGTGVPFPIVSDGTTGAFNAGAVYRNDTYRVRLSKAGFVDTYTAFPVGTGNLATPQGDLLIVSIANRAGTSFTPASVTLDPSRGIVRGLLTPASGTLDGYVIGCTDLDAVSTGTVRYGSAADASPDGALAATSTSGVFYVYNVPPGTVLLRATKTGYGGSCYADVVADSIRLVNGELSPAANANDTITVSGHLGTFSMQGVGDGTIRFLGYSETASSPADYSYSLSGTPAHHRFRVRCAK